MLDTSTIPVVFIQYLRPDGRKKAITMDVPRAFLPVAVAVQEDAHLTFEIEVLTTGEVSMTLTGALPDDEEERDLLICTCPNEQDEVRYTVFDLLHRTADLLGIDLPEAE